jgi:hypothetical protein
MLRTRKFHDHEYKTKIIQKQKQEKSLNDEIKMNQFKKRTKKKFNPC